MAIVAQRINKAVPRVLVVDDDRLMREVLKTIIRDGKLAVAGEAKDGVMALQQVQQLRPDVVCLDVNMPGMNGLEVLQAIREASPRTRVIMITGDASMDTVREAVSHGAVGFIIKPFRADRVITAIRTAMAAPSDSPFS